MLIVMSKSNDVLSLLRDDSNYYGELGSKFLSASDMMTLIENPKDFKKKTESIAFLQGSVFHAAILEKDKLKDFTFVDASTRNTKIYKEFIAERSEDMLLLKKEFEDAKVWGTAMTQNMDFYDMIFAEGNTFEEPNTGVLFDHPFKGKADIVGENVIYDLKTTSDINKFKWTAKKYGYDCQAYIYGQLWGKPLVFLVIDKSTLNLGMFIPTDDFVKSGREKVIKAIENYDKFYGPEATEIAEDYYIIEELY